MVPWCTGTIIKVWVKVNYRIQCCCLKSSYASDKLTRTPLPRIPPKTLESPALTRPVKLPVSKWGNLIEFAVFYGYHGCCIMVAMVTTLLSW